MTLNWIKLLNKPNKGIFLGVSKQSNGQLQSLKKDQYFMEEKVVNRMKSLAKPKL